MKRGRMCTYVRRFYLGIHHAMDVGGSQAQFARPRFQDNPVLAVDFLKALGHVQCTVWRPVVNHNYLKDRREFRKGSIFVHTVFIQKVDVHLL